LSNGIWPTTRDALVSISSTFYRQLYECNPKSAKKTENLTVYFQLFGSVGEKALNKLNIDEIVTYMLMKLISGVNFINI